jgi:hypothetical protein
MTRMMIALPLAGAMMTASLAYAQSVPAQAPTAPLATTNEAAQPEGADCVDIGAADGSADQENPAAAEAVSGADGAALTRAPGENASETAPVAGADSGTAPGGAGSSGWTGGLGGSDIGTSQSEELDTSPQQNHPPVATGLDPISGETAVEGPQAPPPPVKETAAPATDRMAQRAC